jgi:hypothetical protein
MEAISLLTDCHFPILLSTSAKTTVKLTNISDHGRVLQVILLKVSACKTSEVYWSMTVHDHWRRPYRVRCENFAWGVCYTTLASRQHVHNIGEE